MGRPTRNLRSASLPQGIIRQEMRSTDAAAQSEPGPEEDAEEPKYVHHFTTGVAEGPISNGVCLNYACTPTE